ncbi:MAG: hypothetical protein N3E41_08425 [Thermofilaceae archaeon]|nr:hypothetical protein [Thermofilaceae archaeon]
MIRSFNSFPVAVYDPIIIRRPSDVKTFNSFPVAVTLTVQTNPATYRAFNSFPVAV